jgi:protease I
MPSGISGRKIAVLAADGVEQGELSEPWRALADAGAEPHLVSVHPGEIVATRGGERGDRFPVDRLVSEVRAGEFDGLIVPGGGASIDALRARADVLSFTRAFLDADKPVAAISDAPRLLVEADLVRGRTLTSSPSLSGAIRDAGGEWVDEPVVTDQKLVTGRTSAALPPFVAKLLALFERAIDERRLDFMVEQTFPASDPLPGPGAGPASEGPASRPGPPGGPRA